MSWIEVIGISATCVIFIGFLNKGELKIRIYNSIGSILFVIYGLIIGAFSVWLLNGACLLLNIWKIYQIMKEGKKK